jgi:hypothetical protein
MATNMNDRLLRLKRLGLDRLFAFANVAISLVGGLVIWRALPRALMVDLGSTVVALLLLASTVGLAMRARWAVGVTRLAAGVLLAAGLATTAALTLGVVFARAVSAVDSPGPLLFGLVLLAIVPYAIVYPLLLLFWLAGDRAASR